MPSASKSDSSSQDNPAHDFYAALLYLHGEATRNQNHTLIQILELALTHARDLGKNPDAPPRDLEPLLQELTLIHHFRSITPDQRASILNVLQSFHPTADAQIQYPHF